MSRLRFLSMAVLVALVAGVFAPAQTAAAQAPVEEIDRETPYVPGEVVVSFDAGLAASAYQARASALAGKVGAMVARQYENMALFSFAPETDVAAMADRIYATGQVRSAQPNYIYWSPEMTDEILGRTIVSSDYKLYAENQAISMDWDEVQNMRSISTSAYPTFPGELSKGRSWGWDAVQADLVWSETAYSPYVCILDTGAEFNHPDLIGKVANGYDFVNNDTYSLDDNGHGTHVAGIIAARINNGPDTAMGISNYYALAVKVLNAQGYGTSYSVAAGLVYCSRLSYVNVVNMSLGTTTKDKLMWESLRYAVMTYGKLVVAAAGNSSTSRKTYPAAWSTALETGYGGVSNSVASALIAVGAGRAPSPEGYVLWVDRNGDGVKNGFLGSSDPNNEIYYPEDCASGFATADTAYGSNYGHWVDIIAPGEAIYSSTPLYNPFYENYFGSVAPGYDYLSGTSMATAFVSGAAARVFGLLPWNLQDARNARAKDDLIDKGDPLTFAVDPHNDRDFDPSQGYRGQSGIPGVLYGVPYDSDGDGVEDTIKAPYCWPGWEGVAPGKWDTPGSELDDNAQRMNTFTYPIPGGSQDDKAAVYLNVAKALNRGAMLVEVKDASTGKGLSYATLLAYWMDMPGTSYPVFRDRSYTDVGKNSRVMMINLPTKNDGFGSYRVDIARSGYAFTWIPINTSTVQAGRVNMDVYNRISLPPYSNTIDFILEWDNPSANLDMYLWLPQQSGTNHMGTEGGVIGPGNGGLQWYYPASDPSPLFFSNDFLGTGTLLSPRQFDPNWVWNSTTYSPYAQYRFDGGLEVGVDGMGKPFSPVDYVSVLNGTYTGWLSSWYRFKPYYNGAGWKYNLYVTDYSTKAVEPDGYVQQDGDGGIPLHYLNYNGANFVHPVLRVWMYGNAVKTIKMDSSSADCGVDGRSWWQVLEVKADQADWANDTHLGTRSCFAPDNPPTMFPYGGSD